MPLGHLVPLLIILLPTVYVHASCQLPCLPSSATAACLQMMAATEVGRKLLGYSLVRPAREVLFTVVTRGEKYKAGGSLAGTAELTLPPPAAGKDTAPSATAHWLFSPAVELSRQGKPQYFAGTGGSIPLLLWL
jgi:hypothetical protein